MITTNQLSYGVAVLVILPPSETKSDGGRGAPLDLDTLSFPELNPVRKQVAEALVALAADLEASRTALGLGATQLDEVDRNADLWLSPTRPALERYTGVLYDALDLGDLTPGQRRRANRWLVVVSALFGAVRPTDRIPPYRLSMAVNLPGVGPLAGHWRPALDGELTAAAGTGLVVDCRSSTYAAAWTPTGETARRWVHIRVPGATHMAKHTRGLVARHLLGVDREPRTPAALARALEPAFDVALTEPARPGQPWVLDTTVR